MKPSERRRAKIEAIRREKQKRVTNEAMAAVIQDMYALPTKREWFAILLFAIAVTGFVVWLAI